MIEFDTESKYNRSNILETHCDIVLGDENVNFISRVAIGYEIFI